MIELDNTIHNALKCLECTLSNSSCSICPNRPSIDEFLIGGIMEEQAKEQEAVEAVEIFGLSPQMYYDGIENLKKKIAEFYEHINALQEAFIKQHGIDNEFEIVVEGKKKLFRIYAPTGQYVYNRKYEIGLKASK